MIIQAGGRVMEELEAAFTRWDQERREEARVALEVAMHWEYLLPV